MAVSELASQVLNVVYEVVSGRICDLDRKDWRGGSRRTGSGILGWMGLLIWLVWGMVGLRHGGRGFPPAPIEIGCRRAGWERIIE